MSQILADRPELAAARLMWERMGDFPADLLKPGNYLDERLAVPSDAIGRWEPRVVLLADRGPSPELDAAIEGLYPAYREHGPRGGRPDRRVRPAARS